MIVGKLINNFFIKLKNKKIFILLSRIVLLFPIILIGLYLLSVNVFSLAFIKKNYKPSDVWIVDQQGFPMESLRNSKSNRSLEWVEWSDVSPAFQELLIQVEDHRFYNHVGVDFLALSNALWQNFRGISNRGASTISMQLVGLIKKSNKNILQRRSISQKVQQLLTALKLDLLWSKNEILEAYVNLVPFRGELEGLRAASRGYFAKNPSGLNKEEAALLISLLRSPNSDWQRIALRACRILKESQCQSIENLSQQVFSKPYNLPRNREIIPVLSKYFINNTLDSSNNVIHTTLDYRIQNLVLNVMREQIQALQNQNMKDAAVLILETKSGRVVAYAANAGAGLASAEQIDGIQMRRQAGSTLKPFVFATAFDLQLIKPNSLIEDSAADFTVGDGRVYHPKNYDSIFRGLVTAGDALGSSMNVPAVRILQLVGEIKVLENLKSLGFSQLQQDDYYGPSLALGAVDVSLWELTQAYRKLANENSVFSKKTQDDLFNILASPEYRRFTFGMDSLLTLPFAAAVKTGTSKDMRDNWCLGWTSEYTIGVWVGNFNGEPMWNVSGVSGAAPIWRQLMLQLHPNPKSVPTYYEAPSVSLPIHTISRIRYPAAGMLVGMDPDIPQKQQKLPIEIENPQKGDQLFINQRLLSESQKTTLWPLQKGKYKVELKSASSHLVDSVNFEVR